MSLSVKFTLNMLWLLDEVLTVACTPWRNSQVNWNKVKRLNIGESRSHSLNITLFSSTSFLKKGFSVDILHSEYLNLTGCLVPRAGE